VAKEKESRVACRQASTEEHELNRVPRRTYNAPTLTRFGDIRTVTMGATPGYQDSGGPAGLGKSI